MAPAALAWEPAARNGCPRDVECHPSIGTDPRQCRTDAVGAAGVAGRKARFLTLLGTGD